ncbi:MAG: diaminopimelate decarboxylase [Alphaproteobacteria bacterium]|nr:diaminopimelate decarboxylase [Alphaproteobacteria bacterium]
MDHFDYKNGVYHAEDVALDTLAAEVGTPFYCYSSATLTRHFNVFREHFAAENPKICYAVKANGNLAVLRTLAKLGAGADVVSEGEIRLAMAAGIKPSDIVFSGIGKSAQEMKFALGHDIFQFNVESEPELELLNFIAVKMGKKARIAIRVNPDVDPETHAKISTGQKESKFGIAMSLALPVYDRAAKMAGIDVQSVSVHIGSQLTKLAPFAEAFARVRGFVETLRAAGIPISTLDLGGGLGIPYGKEQPPLPEAYSDIVRREVGALGCKLVFEPGRVLVGNAGILVTRVLYVKRSENRIFVIVDAAMNDLIRPTLYSAHHEIVSVVPPAGDAPTELVEVVGPVCETGDVFAEQRLMKVPNAGDLLVLRSAGAYGAVMSGTYNARLLIPEVMVSGEKHALVRPRQTYEELLGRDKIPSWI